MAVTGSNSTDSEDTPFQRSIGAELVDQLSLQDPHYSSQRLLLHVPPSSFSTSFHKSLTLNSVRSLTCTMGVLSFLDYVFSGRMWPSSFTHKTLHFPWKAEG